MLNPPAIPMFDGFLMLQPCETPSIFQAFSTRHALPFAEVNTRLSRVFQRLWKGAAVHGSHIKKWWFHGGSMGFIH
jgi:hypothetical protein